MAIAKIGRYEVSLSSIVIAGCAVLIAFLALYPASMLLYGSLRSAPPGAPGFFTLKNYIQVFSDVEVVRLLANTLTYAGVKVPFALIYGTFLAWVLVRTNAPLKSIILWVTLAFYIWPYIIKAIAYIFVLGPKGGLLNLMLNQAFGLERSLFDVFSMGGLIFVGAMMSAPLVMLIMMSAFASMDPSLEESARMSGAGLLRTFRLTFALLRPAAVSAALLTFIIAIETFDTPAIIGMPARIYVFTTKIYESIAMFPNIGLATAYAIILLSISVTGVFIYRWAVRAVGRYATVTGKAWRAGIIDLGKFRWPISIITLAIISFTFVLPMAILVLGSFVRSYYPKWEILQTLTFNNYIAVAQASQVVRSFTNSIFLAVVGSTIIMLLVAVVGYIVIRTNLKGRGVLDFLTMLPIAFPGIVLATGVLWAYISAPIINVIYGTIWIIMIAYVTHYIPFGMRIMSGSIFQVHKELEDASRMSGGSWITTFTKIMLPLLKPGLIAGWIFMAMHLIKELAASILLYSSGSEVVSIVIFEIWTNKASLEQVGSIGMILVAIIFALYIAAQKLTGYGISRGI